MGLSRAEQQQELAQVKDPVARTALKTTFHLRRYMPLYVFGTVWVLMIALLPSLSHNGGSSKSTALRSGGTTQSATAPGVEGATAATPAPGATGGTAAAGGPAAAGGTAAKSGSATVKGVTGAPVSNVEAGSGITTGGVTCKPGVRQIDFSDYAAPCVNKFTGNNGGSTYRGVTADTIKISIRATADQGGPNSQAVDQVSKAAGQGTADDDYQSASALLPYFNKMFELYGRKVVLEKFGGQGNGTDEAQSKGQEAACADATAIATSVKAFGDIAYGFGYESGPFSDCAAQQKIFVPFGAPYFPERDYIKWDPYIWGGVTECERISHDVAEYMGKRLNGRNAKWAGDSLLQQAPRKFGTYVPNNDDYQHCVNISESDFKTKYNGSITSRYNYTLDVSQFPSEAARGILQFSAAHVSTIILACDPISQIFLTQSAQKNQYHPEWYIIGVAAQDTDGYGRLYDQSEVDGHMFGMSQLGNTDKIEDPNGEAARAFKAVGKEKPAGGALIYYFMVELFNQLQAAGPALTPQAIATGSGGQPGSKGLVAGGGATAAVGTWSWATSHTAIIDTREVYWDGSAKGYDGNDGHYVETYGGKRFKSGEWSNDEPPIYPKKP
jgi:hypothetical protein